MRIDEDALELQRILTEGLLFPVFQPILDLRVRAILGYESLIRGPEDSPLHRPDQLFATAARSGRSLELEHACREASLRAFAAQRLPGRLFLNVTPTCLLDARLMNGHTRALLSELGLAANRIVLELTENERITDLPGIHDALMHYRGRGFQIAIDDLLPQLQIYLGDPGSESKERTRLLTLVDQLKGHGLVTSPDAHERIVDRKSVV